MNIVLVEPEIPPNTGNVGRLCAATRSTLHLVRPLGFRVDDRTLKRAGLDYWQYLDWKVWDGLDEVRAAAPPEARFFFVTTRSRRPYTEVRYRPGDYLVFGRETAGLPQALLDANPESTVTIPMYHESVRSLNLATSVAVVLYEALRQTKEF